ncbi:MAG: hypothetical protein EP330_11880 [Deltaproteobacteria bacterium]|nr:MAG: hypothetical protein EP330_11880 [Deltaproteobacteria bacterium]
MRRLGAALCLALLACGPAEKTLATHGGIEWRVSPASDEARAVLERRLHDAGASGEVHVDGTALVVQVIGPDPALREHLFAHPEFSVHEVDEHYDERMLAELTGTHGHAGASLAGGARFLPGPPPVVVRPAELRTADIASLARGQDASGQDIVTLQLTDRGRERFAAMTTRLVGHRAALVVDGRPVAVPVIREAISGGRVVLSGLREDEIAALLPLSSGALPQPLSVDVERVVGPAQ